MLFSFRWNWDFKVEKMRLFQCVFLVWFGFHNFDKIIVISAKNHSKKKFTFNLMIITNKNSERVKWKCGQNGMIFHCKTELRQTRGDRMNTEERLKNIFFFLLTNFCGLRFQMILIIVQYTTKQHSVQLLLTLSLSPMIEGIIE